MNDLPSVADDEDDALPTLQDTLPGAAPHAPVVRPETSPDDPEPLLLDALDGHGPATLSIPASREALVEPPPPPPMPDWEAFEDRMTDRVLARLLSHGDRLVSPWLQAALAEVLARHMHALGQDLQATLDEGLAEFVTRTISDEVARMRREAADDAARSFSPKQNDA